MWTNTRSAIGNAKKKDRNADVSQLRLQLRAERLADHVARVVAEAPPLTPEQLARVAALLRSGGAAA